MELTSTSSEFYEWFADELEERMNENELGVRDIADLCGVDQSMVDEYLKGLTLPDPWQLILLAEAFGCSVNDLLGFDEELHRVIYEPYLASEMYINSDSYAMCLAERLKTHMHNRGYSVVGLANEMYITEYTIRKWMDVRPKLPTTINLIKVAQLMKCTPSDLLGY